MTPHFHPPPPPRLRWEALTLLELLCVIAVIAVTLGLTVPAVMQIRKAGLNAKCVGNLRVIAAASMAYAGEHGGALPNYYYEDEDGAIRAPDAVVGQWYWHLAPYLNYGRWSTGGMNLGEKNAPGLSGPCVLHCPATDPQREDIDAALLMYPSLRPVTYAPSNQSRGEFSAPPTVFPVSRVILGVYPPRLGQIKSAATKIWLSDSPTAGILNLSTSRWREGEPTAWAYQAFTRHREGANALFYDGHVEWLAIKTFTNSNGGSLTEKIRLYFDPAY